MYLDPPAHGLVPSVDEKSQIQTPLFKPKQALGRPDGSADEGKPSRSATVIKA
jgi:hypothetical protein